MHKMGADVTVNEPVNWLWINVDTQFALVGVEQGTLDQRADDQCLLLQLFDCNIFITMMQQNKTKNMQNAVRCLAIQQEIKM